MSNDMVIVLLNFLFCKLFIHSFYYFPLNYFTYQFIETVCINLKLFIVCASLLYTIMFYFLFVYHLHLNTVYYSFYQMNNFILV